MSEVSFLLDEHLPSSVAEELKSRGVDIGTVHDFDLTGASDSEILKFADEDGRAVVTQDTDFLELGEENHSGIAFLTDPMSIGDLTREIVRILENFEPEELGNTIFTSLGSLKEIWI